MCTTLICVTHDKTESENHLCPKLFNYLSKRHDYVSYNDITFMDQKLLVSFPTDPFFPNLRLLGMKREAFDP